MGNKLSMLENLKRAALQNASSPEEIRSITEALEEHKKDLAEFLKVFFVNVFTRDRKIWYSLLYDMSNEKEILEMFDIFGIKVKIKPTIDLCYSNAVFTTILHPLSLIDSCGVSWVSFSGCEED